MNKLFKNITCGEPRRLIKPILWNTAASIVNLFPFICLGYIVRLIYGYFVSGELDKTAVWTVWGVMLIAMAAAYMIENMACKVTYRDGFDSSAKGRIKLAEHIRKLPLGFLTKKDAGELGNTIMNDFSRTEQAITHILPQVISGAILTIIVFIVMLFADWHMAFAMMAGFPASLLVLWAMYKIQKKLDTQLSLSRSRQISRIQEYLYGMKIIKAYNLQGQNFDTLKNACYCYRDDCIRFEARIGPLNLLASSLLRFGLPLMTILGCIYLTNGTLTIPAFAAFLLVGTRIFDPLSVSVMNLSGLVSANMAGERIMDILNEPAMSGQPDSILEHDIRFENVTFGYGKNTVLHEVSAEMTPGTLTALVGPSGSGKSTMLRLIARFYDPCHGRVLVGGKDISQIDPEKLMQNISMVFQEVYLFEDTIAENIRYGRENATREEIEQAARIANCYDFISRLPKGFDTLVGEGGSTLSGGEKQRISIARAVLKNAPIVLLDEATSSLDPDNEAEIQQAISRLVEGHTVIVIAHRLKTVVDADHIIVLNEGRVAQTGTHEELLTQEGIYQKLWNIQQQTSGWEIN